MFDPGRCQQSKIKENLFPITIITKDLKTKITVFIYGLFYNSVSRLPQTVRGKFVFPTRHEGTEGDWRYHSTRCEPQR